jgi:hypothetical protein
MINPKPASRAAGNARKPLFSSVTALASADEAPLQKRILTEMPRI